MTKRADSLIEFQQGSVYEVVPDGFETVTSPLNPPRQISELMRHFDPEVYDLSSDSHLTRLVKVLLGESGVGLLRKRQMVARLQSSLGGTHFLDLDRFYGSIFGIRRRMDETLDFDPYSETATGEDWALAHVKDASYRSRIMKFARAIHLGGTRDGIEAMAEAILGIDVDVVEEAAHSERWRRTWGDVAAVGTWGDVAALGTWGDVGWRTASPLEAGGDTPYHVVRIHPRGQITWEEVFDLERAVERIKPAGIVVRVLQTPEESFDTVAISAIHADSENWELRPVDRIAGATEGTTLLANRERFAWASRQAEAWSYNETSPTTVAYFRDADVSEEVRFDEDVQQTPPQANMVDGVLSYSYPGDALTPVERILSGRSVSDGILVGSPFATPKFTEASDGTLQQVVRPDSDLGSDVTVEGSRLNVTSPRALPASPKFWVSPVRPPGSVVNEIVEVRFSQSVPVNRFSYSYSRYPCNVRLQAWQPETGSWLTISRSEEAVSVPRRVNLPLASNRSMHTGKRGHWKVVKGSLEESVTASIFRFVFKRKSNGVGPLGIGSDRAPYSLAVKDISFGYQIVDTSTIPNYDPEQPIITVANSAGYTAQYFIERFPATLANDSLPTAWKCEPMPIAQAVVSLYLDVRDETGLAQGVDRVWLDPVTVGPTYNVYSSDDDPPGLTDAESLDNPVIPSEIYGSVANNSGGIVFPNESGYIEFDNRPLRFDPRATWWSALHFTPRWSSGESPARTAVLMSAGPDIESAFTDMSLVWRNTFLEFRVGKEVARLTPSDEIVSGQPVRIFLSYSPLSGPQIHLRHPGGVIDDNFTQTNARTVGVVELVLGLPVTLIDSANVTDDGLVLTNDGSNPWDSARIVEYTMPNDIPLTFIFDAHLTEWQTGASRTLWSIDNGAAGGKVMKIEIDATGHIAFSLSSDGNAWTTVTSDEVPAFVDVERGTLRIDWNNDTGDTDFWSVASDGALTSLGLTESLALTPISVSSTMTIGGLFGSPSLAIDGTVQRVTITEGAVGYSVLDVHFVVASRLPESLRVGSSIGTCPITLHAFALGFGERLASFVLENIRSYCKRPDVGSGRTDGTILRYHPSYSKRFVPEAGPCFGWMGGPLAFWDDVEWTPLLHSVTLTKGYVDIPPTRAKFLKLEFTNLAAEPHETLLNVNRRVRVLPTPPERKSQRSVSTLESSTQRLTGVSRFSDAPPLTERAVDAPEATSMLVPIDPTARERLSDTSFAFHGMEWQPRPTMSVSPTKSKHSYTVLNIPHTSKVAFFVALRSIRVGRFRPQSLSNARVYYESFISTDGIESTTFDVTEGTLSTPDNDVDSPLSVPRVAVSKTMPSRTAVEAIQFATTQTPALPLIVDDEFRDPALPYSDFVSTASWTPVGDASLMWDRATSRMRVVRDLSSISSTTPADTPIVHPPITPVFSSRPVAVWNYSDEAFGGIISPSFSPSPAGVLYVAARVSTEKELADGLHVRLYGSDGTTMLLDETINPQPYVETEASFSYVLGSNPDLESTMTLSVEQVGGDRGSWTMLALSAFDEAVVWEFSNDSGQSWVPALTGRNSLDSAVHFPDAGTGLRWKVTAYRHNTIIGSIQIRPWYDQRTRAR